MDINGLPNPTDLVYFQEIALTQNLSRAAERLGVGQPALSHSLKRLEGQMKVKLFHRRSSGLKLTPAGVALLRESNRLRSIWEAVVSEVRKSDSELTGRFTLGCHQSVALYALKTVIADIYDKFPGIEIRLEHVISRVICEGVISGNLDFGIVANPVRHPDLIIHKLARDEFGFWSKSANVSNVLIYDPALAQSQSLLKKLRGQVFSRTITSKSLEVIAMLAASGAGMAILPSRVVKAMGSHLALISELPKNHDEISFIYHVNIRDSASSQVLIKKFRQLVI